MHATLRRFVAASLLCFSVCCSAEVTRQRLTAADTEPDQWLSHGRNYAEDRESPLQQIDRGNVATLGLAWSFDTSTHRGLEASPLVIDGVIYTTGSWSRVYAISAANGEQIWSYDPEVPRSWGVNACCDVVNRGVAAWGDKVYVGTLDGRLVALDRTTGAPVWQTLTIDQTRPYTITGAPRAINGKIMIGNGGAEYGVRGYISAYDADTGAQVWRFYTVPGSPALPPESAAMKMAAKTWRGDVFYQVGGGGTVWDSMAYDPVLNLLYFGVGNGSPWNRHIRSPGGGDNLFLSSIVAVNADTGEYAWHYQTTPADTWDYTATQHIILADLTIDGEQRKVLMQAPKNGFFYVLDRETGKLISAEKYTKASWASHVDLATGRPVETSNADHITKTQMTGPAPSGGHNWQPMAFNQSQALVYIPAMESIAPYSTGKDFQYSPGGHWNLGQNDNNENSATMTSIPPALMRAVMQRIMKGRLIAWDPVAQTERWRVEHPTMWNGGVLTTKTGLVFQGTGDGRLVAYDAANGEVLWQTETGTGIIAPPISFALEGTQYISVMAGWGGVVGLMLNLPQSASAGTGRLLTYRLGGTATLPTNTISRTLPEPPDQLGSDATIGHGANLYNVHCMRCHGAGLQSGGLVADLRYMSPESHKQFKNIVLGGVLSSVGMVSFADQIDANDADAIHSYIISAAHLQWQEDNAAPWWKAIKSEFYDAFAYLVVFFGFSS